MLMRLKQGISTKMLASVATLGMMVAAVSVKPACWLIINQPKVPERLRNNN
jgi:cyclic lactone autoinducer peptide